MRDGEEVVRWIDWRPICYPVSIAMAAESLDRERILPWTAAESIPTCFFRECKAVFDGENRALGPP
jgi:hypothetical protein